MGKNRPVSSGRKDKKQPISQSKEESYYKQTPLWSFKYLDNSYDKWQIESTQELLSELKSYEGLTWQDIMSASGGKRKGNGSNSHYIAISEICREAQQRLIAIKLDAEDTLFSLRIGSKKRLWGLLRSRAFEMIWYDKNHEIYPLDN